MKSAGWSLGDHGLLWKEGRAAMVPTYLPMRLPSDPGYNVRTDSPAALLGAQYIEEGRWAGRFMHAGVIVNANARPVDESLCAVCQGAPYRVRVEHPDPAAQPWEQAWTYCRRCVTLEMLAENERRVQSFAPPPPPRRRY